MRFAAVAFSQRDVKCLCERFVRSAGKRDRLKIADTDRRSVEFLDKEILMGVRPTCRRLLGQQTSERFEPRSFTCG